MFRHRPVMLAVMIGLALLLAACGGDEPGELPTPFVLGSEETPEVDAPTPEPENDTQAAADAEIDEVDDTDPPDEPDEPAPPGPPLDDAPPGPGDDADPPGAVRIEILTDFSTLSPGDLAVLVGQLQALEETDAAGEELFVIVDEAGNEVLVDLPPPIAQSHEGEAVEMEGEIAAPGEGETRLRLLVSNIRAAGEGVDDLPPFLTEADDDVFAPGPRSLEIELEAELTALQAHDALVVALEEELAGWDWMELSGSRLIGWTLVFVNPEDDSLSAYLVEMDGSVWRVEPEQDAPMVFDAPPGPGEPDVTPEVDPARPLPLEREQIVVDSDQVEQMTAPADDEDRPPFEAYPLLTLRVETDARPVWSVADVEVITIDATVQPD
jgi:hypothetical protein